MDASLHDAYEAMPRLRIVIAQGVAIEMTTPQHSMSQTNWAQMRDAASGSSTAQASLDAIARRAWPAIYAFVRASGHTNDAATDLTQGFIADVFLGRNLIEKADQERGRFRTLLMSAVRNYLNDSHRRKTAVTRTPAQGLRSLHAMHDVGHEVQDLAGVSPERAFHTRYVGAIVRAAASRLQRELVADGNEISWEIFRMRVLQAAMTGDVRGYDEIANALGIDKGTCAARVLLAKRRFAKLLKEEILTTVEDPADLDDEVAQLLALLGSR